MPFDPVALRARTALENIAAMSNDPDNWEPYDAFGDMVDTDPSNNGDVRDFGVRLGLWYAAKIARKALGIS